MNRLLLVLSIVMTTAGLIACGSRQTAPDEAKIAGRAPSSFIAADEDYFHDMDGGIPLTPGRDQGRNTWLVWTGGNDRFWDLIEHDEFRHSRLAENYLLLPDSLQTARHNRWDALGVVNEPCFNDATGPNPERFGLWLDQRSVPTVRPIRSRTHQKYPGVQIGARGSEGAGRLVLRRRHRRRRAAAVSESRVRRAARQGVGRPTLLHRPFLLSRKKPGAAVPRRHVVRLLPRRAKPGPSAGRSRTIRPGRT